MARTLRYLKPFALMIAFAVILLVGQVYCDLALPDYMSNIVNVGVQQGGVTSALPANVSPDTMTHIKLFLSAEQAAAVDRNYTLAANPHKSAATQEYQLNADLSGAQSAMVTAMNLPDTMSAGMMSLLKQSLPADQAAAVDGLYTLADVYITQVYQLNSNISQSDRDLISMPVGKAMIVIGQITSAMANPVNGYIEIQGFNTSGQQIPAGTDLFAMLGQMPADQLSQILTSVASIFDQFGNDYIVQAAAPSIIAEYKTIGVDTGAIQQDYILWTGFIMLLYALLSMCCNITVSFIAARVAAGFARNLRGMVFSRVETFAISDFDHFTTASLITRTTNDITQMQMFSFMLIRMVIYAPIMAVGGVIKAVGKAASMSWIFTLSVVVVLVMMVIVYFIAMPKFKRMQKLIDKLNQVVRERLSGLMVSRAFNTQKFEEGRFDTTNKDLMGVSLFVNRIFVIVMPFIMFVMNGTMLLIVWVGAHQIENSSMQVGDLFAFIQYSMQIIMAFMMIGMLFIMMPRAAVSAGRISDVLDHKTAILDPKDPRPLSDISGNELAFDHVSFGYPSAEQKALEDIDFTARAGKVTAVIGATGSGKTTLINLITRFYEVTEGKVTIGGVDVRDLKQHDLHSLIGLATQNAILLEGTIRSNLLYANPDATDEQIEEACRIAQASEFIDRLPDGYDSDISQAGTNLSGGQKQRVSIARALMRNPKIYLFDDTFSALDYKTDAQLRRALAEYITDAVVFIVAQRINTIKNADLIIVLDEGRVVGKGQHAELMANCAAYREIALSQLSEEELA